MALNGIPISEDQCIGDSLDTINDSFNELDLRTLNLFSDLGTATTNISALSSNLGTATTNISALSSNLGTATTNIAALSSGLGTATTNISTLSSNLGTATTNISTLSSNLGTATTNISVISSSYVKQIVAGTNITISPVEGTGIVTINSTGGGGGGSFAGTTTASTLTADTLMLRVEVGSYYKYIQLFDINGVYNEPIIVPLPVITSSLAVSGTQNQPFNYQITATSSPSAYNAFGLPSGLTINTTTGTISGTPSSTGVSSVSLSATNSAGTGIATLALTVNPPAVLPPVITSTTETSAIIGQPFSYQITATNSPSAYYAFGLPSGLSINTTTGTISGSTISAGISSISLSATNSAGTGTATIGLTSVAPTSLFTLTGPFAENIPQQINITSTNPDTLYIYDNWNGSTLTYTSTIVIVNGTPSASISHTTDRIGDQFGYSISGVTPQAFGTLTGGNVNLTI